MGDMSNLSALGLSEEIEQIYEHVLHRGACSPDSIGPALGLSREAVEEGMTELLRLKMVRLSSGDLEPIDPAVSIERLIEQQMERLNSELRDVAAVRTAIPRLERLVQSNTPVESHSDIEQITSMVDIRARLEDLAFFTRTEMLTMHPTGPLTPENIQAARPLDVRMLRRGLVMRTIMLREGLEDAATGAYIRELSSLGAQIRYVESRLDRALVFDRQVAVVPVDPGASERGALIVHQPALVVSIVQLFERVWATATPAETLLGTDEGDPPLTAVELQVLMTLTRVDKDEIGAREMNMSIRTFRRYVADLMLRLGASNRFQAALLAKERGWL